MRADKRARVVRIVWFSVGICVNSASGASFCQVDRIIPVVRLNP